MLGRFTVRLDSMNRRVAERERMLARAPFEHPPARSCRRPRRRGRRARRSSRDGTSALRRVHARVDFVSPGRHAAVVTNADGRSDRAVDDRHAARDVLQHVALLLTVEKSRKRNRIARRHGVRGQIPGLEQLGADQPGRSSAVLNTSSGGPPAQPGHARVGKQRRQLSKQAAQAHVRLGAACEGIDIASMVTTVLGSGKALGDGSG